MKTINTRPYMNAESGFALLMTLIVVGVVLSVGLAILELSIKQVRLSAMAKDSEIAFHAANAGMECARYTRRMNSDDMEDGLAITANCFGVSVASSPTFITDIIGAGEVNQYDYQMTWGLAGAQRCTSVVTLVASADFSGGGLTVPNMASIIPGYPEADFECDAGGRCTAISVRGYNKPCPGGVSFPPGTIQREVLVEF